MELARFKRLLAAVAAFQLALFTFALALPRVGKAPETGMPSAGASAEAGMPSTRSEQAQSAQSETVQTIHPLDEPLPVDPKLRVDTLPNGLKYYVRHNQKPEKRLELRLVVSVGSVLEEDDQRGLAHFAEHMAFNGTKSFPKQDLVDYFESVGMRFGPEINAYTRFDETVYMLQVPTDSAGVVEKSVKVLEQWAHELLLDPTEIDKERGVVVEEWRLGRGAEARMLDKQLPIFLKGSRYAQRLPIGEKAVIDTFQHDTLSRFYRDWYRPELMAVIAVGDVDTAAVGNLIRKHFSSVPAAARAPERKTFPIPDNEATLYAITSDPEATNSSVSVYYKRNPEKQVTAGDYRHGLVENLYHDMLNQRLFEITRQPDAPFLYAYSSEERFLKSKDFLVLGAGVKDNGVPEGLEALMTEAERIERHGFTKSELDRQKKESLRSFGKAFKESDKTESESLAGEYLRNYLYGEPIPGIQYEYELAKQVIPTIPIEEVNSFAQRWTGKKNRFVLVNQPDKPDVALPSEDVLSSVFNEVEKRELAPYGESVSDKPLVENLPPAATIVSSRATPDLGIVDWTLSNGVKVVLKPTDFKNDEILFSAFSPGGHSLVPDTAFVAASTAAQVMEEGGLGELNLIDLQKRLAGKILSVSPWIEPLYEGISGNASPEDLETLFQLIYLSFTAPREDSLAFEAFRSRLRGFLENRSATPETAFEDTLQVTMAQHHFRERPYSSALLNEMDLSRSLSVYRDRFADASDFTFFFVGNIDTTSIKPLILKYIGALPALHRAESWKDVGLRPPKGVVEKTVRRGIEPKSLARVMFTGPFHWTRQERYDLNSLVEVLGIKLRETLREDLGGTYGVDVSESASHFPVEGYEITISFGCSPERTDELTRTVFQQIDSLKTSGASEMYLAKVKEIQRRDREVGLRENSFWLEALKFWYRNGEDPLNILRYYELVDALSSQAIQKAAQTYLDFGNYVKVVLYPGEGKH